MDKPGRMSRIDRGSSKFKLGYGGILVVMVLLHADPALAQPNTQLIADVKQFITAMTNWLKERGEDIQGKIPSNVAAYKDLADKTIAIEKEVGEYEANPDTAKEDQLKANSKIFFDFGKKAETVEKVLEGAKLAKDNVTAELLANSEDIKKANADLEGSITAYKGDASADNEGKLKAAITALEAALKKQQDPPKTWCDRAKCVAGYGIVGVMFGLGGWAGGSKWPIPQLKPGPAVEPSSNLPTVATDVSTKGGIPWEIVVPVLIVMAVIIGIGAFFYYRTNSGGSGGSGASDGGGKSDGSNKAKSSSTGGGSTGGAAGTSNTSSAGSSAGKVSGGASSSSSVKPQGSNASNT